ncbi:uncharacterized protein [Dysidea avara]|uniref:uncharacterized protein n=1 Tax=Dysidea avara TaxID=196820 RepID=UPI00331D0837
MKLLILLGVLTYSIVANGLLNCENATIDFQTNNFDCYVAFVNAAVQTLSGGMVDNDTIELLCVNETCRTDLMHYAAACQSNETITAQTSAILLGCIALPDNMTERCFDRVAAAGGHMQVLQSLMGVQTACSSQYLFGMCSPSCMQNLTMLIDQLGCCYSEYLRFADSTLDNEFIQFGYAVAVRDYFQLCSIQPPMFCQNGTVPPPNQCSAAVQALYGPNDNCASAVRMELAANSDFDNIFDPMTAISGCPRRVTAVIRYCSFINDTLQLSSCDLESVNLFGPEDFCSKAAIVILNSDLTDRNARLSFREANNLLLSYCGIIGCRERLERYSTTCLNEEDATQIRVFVSEFGCARNNRGSCLAIQQTGVLDALEDSFSLVDPVGICASATLSCSDQCKQVIRSAISRTGCCVFELANAGLQVINLPISVDDVFQGCGIDNPGMCDVIPATLNGTTDPNTGDNNNNGGGGGGVAAMMAYSLMVMSLSLLTLLFI